MPGLADGEEAMVLVFPVGREPYLASIGRDVDAHRDSELLERICESLPAYRQRWLRDRWMEARGNALSRRAAR